LAFAIRRLRSLRIERIAYVDLDAHHCDRFEAAFGNDDDFLIVSTHEEIRWSFTDTLRDNAPDRLVNILLPKSCNDGEFSSVIHQIVLPATRRFSPEALIIQGGGDAPRDDPLSRLSNGALWRAFSNLHDLLAHLKTIHSL
jgi:acetoin utilization protein AcuC